MDFSSEFVALRDWMEENLASEFTSEHNAEVAGRMAALFSSFSVSADRKMLGLLPMGINTHSHEYRLLFAAPTMNEQVLEDWWGYAAAAEEALVVPDGHHGFSLVSILLVSQNVDKAVQKRIKKLSAERQYTGKQCGWSSIRFAVIDLAAGKTFYNTAGEPFKAIVKPFFAKRA